MQKPLLFPEALYGNEADTSAWWGDLITLAKLDFAQFSARLQALEFIDVCARPGKIILWGNKNGTLDARPFWRLNGITAVFSKWWRCLQQGDLRVSAEFTTLDDAAALQRKIVLKGIESPWFIFAMLVPDRNGPGFVFPRSDVRESFYLPILRRLIHFLPEIIALLPRLYYNCGSLLMPFRDRRNPHLWWYIWSFLLGLVERFRPSSTFAEMREVRIPLIYQGNVVNALLGEGIIRRVGDRYVLDE